MTNSRRTAGWIDSTCHCQCLWGISGLQMALRRARFLLPGCLRTTIPARVYRQWLIAQKEAAAAEEKRLLEEEEANREVKSLIRCCAMHCAARLVASRASWLL